MLRSFHVLLFGHAIYRQQSGLDSTVYTGEKLDYAIAFGVSRNDTSPAVNAHIPQPIRSANALRAESHDGIDNVIVVLLEGLDSLLPADRGLGHDELNVLWLETSLVNLLTVILLLGLGVGTGVDGLALVTVIVPSVVTRGTLLVLQLLSSSGLCLRVQVLNLGLTENAIPSQYATHLYVTARNSHPGVAVW